MAFIKVVSNGKTFPYNDMTKQFFATLLKNGGAEIVGEVNEEPKVIEKKNVEVVAEVKEVLSEAEYLESLSVDELKEIAKNRGINIGRSKTKKAILNKLK